MRNIEPPDLEVNTIEIGKSIDVSVHEINSFQRLLDDHNIWSIYLFYYPISTYLYNKDNLTMKDLFHVNFRYPKLKVIYLLVICSNMSLFRLRCIIVV